MSGLLYLADTNILLRLIKSDAPEFPVIRRAIRTLKARGEQICYAPQNIVEFWNVCTRPSDRNGYGLLPKEAMSVRGESVARSPFCQKTN